jgi:hypothetical protein
MKSFEQFVSELNENMGISLPKSWSNLSEAHLAQKFLQKLNEYFFQTYEGIGTTKFNNEELQYFSEFHKFWEAHHKKILNVRIDKKQSQLAAQALSDATNKYGKDIFKVTRDTIGLNPEAVAQVRFFTANQDFREPLKNQFEKYFEDPTRFDAKEIDAEPSDFLKFLGMTRLSQTDKRLDFARNAAQFLIEKGISAYNIPEHFNHDAVQIRETLVKSPNMGYGPKKANMFIRDMVELKVWSNLKNLDGIDVASDINTMKLALRMQILQADIPLLSSFLDIFCYQYSHIDEMSAKAWRMVWQEWKSLAPSTAPLSPCQMDFLLYRIGREYCDDIVVQYTCGKKHTFYHFGARLKNCPTCQKEKIHTYAQTKGRFLPCQIDPSELPREKGQLLLRDDNLLKTFDGVCIFEDVCKPKTDDFRALNPPKSISIKGQTSWTNSYAYQEQGGGGMMG